MNDEDDYMDDDLEIDFDADSIDEHEYEISATSNRPISWRRIEMMKEHMWLREQLEDMSDWDEASLR